MLRDWLHITQLRVSDCITCFLYFNSFTIIIIIIISYSDLLNFLYLNPQILHLFLPLLDCLKPTASSCVVFSYVLAWITTNTFTLLHQILSSNSVSSFRDLDGTCDFFGFSTPHPWSLIMPTFQWNTANDYHQ